MEVNLIPPKGALRCTPATLNFSRLVQLPVVMVTVAAASTVMVPGTADVASDRSPTSRRRRAPRPPPLTDTVKTLGCRMSGMPSLLPSKVEETPSQKRRAMLEQLPRGLWSVVDQPLALWSVVVAEPQGNSCERVL